MIRKHLDGLLVWTKLRISHGALDRSPARRPPQRAVAPAADRLPGRRLPLEPRGCSPYHADLCCGSDAGEWYRAFHVEEFK